MNPTAEVMDEKCLIGFFRGLKDESSFQLHPTLKGCFLSAVDGVVHYIEFDGNVWNCEWRYCKLGVWESDSFLANGLHIENA